LLTWCRRHRTGCRRLEPLRVIGNGVFPFGAQVPRQHKRAFTTREKPRSIGYFTSLWRLKGLNRPTTHDQEANTKYCETKQV
jgi:hypothetical protein